MEKSNQLIHKKILHSLFIFSKSFDNKYRILFIDKLLEMILFE